MRAWALEFLVCPRCQGSFALRNANMDGERVRSGMLACEGCGMAYTIIDFVPRFVSNEQYVGSFGDEWHLFSGVKNSRTAMSIDELKNYMALDESDFRGKTALEIGCGAGPYLDVTARVFGAQKVIGVDLSRAVDAAVENVGELENVTIIQADLFNLPLKKESFDTVYSLGVLHHTPNTKAAFDAVVPYVACGGTLAVWLYGDYWKRKTASQDRIRKWTTKLSSKSLYGLSRFMARLAPLYRLPLIGNALRETLPMAMDDDYEVRALNTHDMYSPVYLHRHTIDELYDWFSQNGFEQMRPARYLLGMRAQRCKAK